MLYFMEKCTTILSWGRTINFFCCSQVVLAWGPFLGFFWPEEGRRPHEWHFSAHSKCFPPKKVNFSVTKIPKGLIFFVCVYKKKQECAQWRKTLLWAEILFISLLHKLTALIQYLVRAFSSLGLRGCPRVHNYTTVCQGLRWVASWAPLLTPLFHTLHTGKTMAVTLREKEMLNFFTSFSPPFPLGGRLTSIKRHIILNHSNHFEPL